MKPTIVISKAVRNNNLYTESITFYFFDCFYK